MEEFPPIRERPRPANLAQMVNPSLRVFSMGEVSVLTSRDTVYPGDLRWHISISCKDRDPTWEEIKHIQNRLKPDLFFCMPMPPEKYWLSIHEHAYHLWEIRDDNLVQQWIFDGVEARRYKERVQTRQTVEEER